MTSNAFRDGLMQTAQAVFLAPILLAALIGFIPLLIPCIACRCCKGIFASICKAIQH